MEEVNTQILGETVTEGEGNNEVNAAIMSEEVNSEANTPMTYLDVVSRIVEEERRLSEQKKQNEDLIPVVEKKTKCILPINQQALQYFKNSNLTTNFSQYVKEKRVDQSAEAILNHCAQFISFVKGKLRDTLTATSIREILLTIVKNNRLIFQEHLDALTQSGLKHATLLTRISSLIHLVNWMMLTTETDFQSLIEINKRLEMARTRYVLLQRRIHQTESLDDMIKSRRWVESGIVGLQQMMKDSWSYFDALICLSLHHGLSSHQYSWALGYTLASLWVYAVNSRSQSIEKMTMKAIQEIQLTGFHLSQEFKTSAAYKFQIVSPTNIVELFIKYIRPHIIPPEIDSDDAIVFPSFKGTPLLSGEATKKINSIFAVYGYDITITTLRDMLATHVEDLYQDGKLSEQGKSVNSINKLILPLIDRV